jgi:hypothetical protein
VCLGRGECLVDVMACIDVRCLVWDKGGGGDLEDL